MGPGESQAESMGGFFFAGGGFPLTFDSLSLSF